MAPKRKLGSLGGPNTFGAEAAHQILERYPIFDEIVYFDTAEDAVEFTRCDALCAPQQMSRTGLHPRIQTRVAVEGSKLFVIAEVAHAFHCSLLVKPGTQQSAIRRVLGHTGSVTQSRDWLREHLPQAEVIIVDTNSMGAAKEAAGSDGSTASIGTPGMAREMGLTELHKDIDGGSVGAYWAISPHQIFDKEPNRLVVTGRFTGDDRMSELIKALSGAGFCLQTNFCLPTGTRLYEYDYALRFGGKGALAGVQRAVATVKEARLAGAFTVAV
jgi:prephenate dehydratase